MLYDYKTEKLVQDVVLEDIEILIDDITEEFYTLHRYNELDIYLPSYLAREIIARLLEEVDELWVHADSENELLYEDDNEVLITIANDGMIFIEEARIKGVLKSCEDSSLAYVYDGFGKKDIDVLSEGVESILVFGLEEENIENSCYKCEYSCKDKDENAVSTSAKSSYFINEKPVTKEEFDKKYAEFEDKHLDNVRDMLLSYCEFMDEMNEWASLFRW